MPAVWAYSANSPAKTCSDARLLGGGTNLHYPAGNDHGQAGWDIGLSFNNLGDLVEKMRAAGPSRFSRLAINLHGAPGSIDVDSNNTPYTFDKLWNRYSSQLAAINMLLDAGAVVLIMGCNVAAGDVGAAFLSDLSSKAFPGHKVVGFTTVGVTMRQFRHGEFCSEPGMRDSTYDSPSQDDGVIKPQREKEVLTLPWASETSPHHKTALNGKIIDGAEPPTPKTDYSAHGYLVGRWSVTIGTWNGYFVFQNDGNMYWVDEGSARRHAGHWAEAEGAINWYFSDDPPGFRRTFMIVPPLKTSMKGEIFNGGGGVFVMSKQF